MIWNTEATPPILMASILPDGDVTINIGEIKAYMVKQAARIKSLEAALGGFIEAWSFNDSPTDMYAKCDKATNTAREALSGDKTA